MAWRILTTFVAGLLTLLAVLPPPATAADNLKFSLNFIPYGVHIGFYVAREKGFYRDAGMEVEI